MSVSSKSGFITDPQSGEGCVINCNLSKPIRDSVALGWVSYVDTYNTEIDCQVRANQFFL